MNRRHEQIGLVIPPDGHHAPRHVTFLYVEVSCHRPDQGLVMHRTVDTPLPSYIHEMSVVALFVWHIGLVMHQTVTP